MLRLMVPSRLARETQPAPGQSLVEISLDGRAPAG